MVATASTSAVVKRKRIFLSISDKVEVIKMLDHGSCSTVIATKYSIAIHNTVTIVKLHYNHNYSLLQLSELFTYPNTPLPKGVRISEDLLYI